MEQVNVSAVKFKAFDGTIFDDQVSCLKYEIEKRKENVTNFRHFEIVFPMQDQATDCTAYLIQSEKEFGIFMDLLDDEFSDFYAEDHTYEGAGWYVLQSDSCGWASVATLSSIVQDWSKVMNKIANEVMMFKEEQ